MKIRHYLIVLAVALVASFGMSFSRSRAVALGIYEEIRWEHGIYAELEETLNSQEGAIQSLNNTLAGLISTYSTANALMETYNALTIQWIQAQNFSVEQAVASYQETADEAVLEREAELGVSQYIIDGLQEELEYLREQQRLAEEAAEKARRQAEEAARAEVASQLTEAIVTRIIDGDTIDVNINGTIERVRFIAVDAPERRQAGFQEATDFVAAHAPVGSTIWLQTDGRNRDNTRARRLRRYIWLEVPTDLRDESQIRSRMLNAMLLENGHARVSIVRGDDPIHEALFRRLEQ